MESEPHRSVCEFPVSAGTTETTSKLALFEEERQCYAQSFSIERYGDEFYVSLALPSSVDAALGLCVNCDQLITFEGVSIST
jgi:hypothetical protein